MGRRFEWILLQRGHPEGQQMLNITHHQGDANQNLTPVRVATIKNSRNNNDGENQDKKKSLCTVGGNANCCSHFGGQLGVSPKSYK